MIETGRPLTTKPDQEFPMLCVDPATGGLVLQVAFAARIGVRRER